MLGLINQVNLGKRPSSWAGVLDSWIYHFLDFRSKGQSIGVIIVVLSCWHWYVLGTRRRDEEAETGGRKKRQKIEEEEEYEPEDEEEEHVADENDEGEEYEAEGEVVEEAEGEEAEYQEAEGEEYEGVSRVSSSFPKFQWCLTPFFSLSSTYERLFDPKCVLS